MKALSLQLLGGVAAEETTQGAEAVGQVRAGAVRKGSPRFGEALGQALAKHAVRAASEGEVPAPGGESNGVEAGAAEAGTEGRAAHPIE